MPAVGADPEAMGLDRLSDGDTLYVPTGRSVLDVLLLSGMCEDGQLATRDEERREQTRTGREAARHFCERVPTGLQLAGRLCRPVTGVSRGLTCRPTGRSDRGIPDEC